MDSQAKGIHNPVLGSTALRLYAGAPLPRTIVRPLQNQAVRCVNMRNSATSYATVGSSKKAKSQ
jgi:hypothetical protein